MLRRPNFLRLFFVLWASLGLTLAACSSAPGSPTPVQPVAGASATTIAPTSPPTQVGSEVTPASTEPASSATDGQLRLVLASEGNEARFRVTEQLASLSLPSDAIGVTQDITGQIVLAADGTVTRDESRFVVDLTTLTSDNRMRDGYVQRNTLQTDTYPTTEFVPTEALGLPSPLPTSGEVTFQLVGELTLHGSTRPVTWNVTARVEGSALVGTASTSLTFGDFGMTIPRVARVLSIEDNIRLEYDFHLLLDASAN